GERVRRKVGAVLAGLDRAPGKRESLELLSGLRHLRRERAGVPVEAGVARLHRLVPLAVKAPVEIEAVHFVPVALAERVGETTVDRAAGVEADEIAPGGRAHRLLEHCRRGRERPATLDLARLRRFVDEQP